MNDKQIKREAVEREENRVFENMNTGRDIYAECSDGMWIKEHYRNANGTFGWLRWKKVQGF